MNYKSILKKQTFIIVISVICLTIAVIGGSFALFFGISDDSGIQTVKAGELEVNFKNGSLVAVSDDILPMSDTDGLAQIGTNFAIENTGTLTGAYYIAVYNNTTGIDITKLLDHSYIRISIDGSTPQTLSEVKHTEDTLTKTNQNEIHYELLKGTIPADAKNSTNDHIKTHNIKIWIKEDAPTDIIGKLIRLQIEVVSVVGKVEYKDASGAERPDLDNGLIPVTWNGTDWVKADTYEKWYDYDAQWWANAVTVSASSRSKYTSAASNTPIEMNDIETMWVWIPRYEYNSELLKTPANYGGTAENPGTQTQPKGIEINFINKDTVSPSSSNFTIHDAFKWGDEEASKEQLSGIWVAKFEMSTGSTTCTPATNSVGSGCDLTTISPQIKPNVTSWRGARIGTMWTAIHNNMNGSSNQYGITNSDVHLMKNMEWGAVAYLSQSKYGKYGNQNYTGANKEVAINNCSTYKTGIGGDTVSASSSSTTCTTNTYETEKGQAASTTGNIYGIYDMSGGATEYVMGIQKVNGSNEPAVGYSTSANSGWSGKLADGTKYPAEGDTTTKTHGSLNNDVPKRYYDLYEYGTSYTDYTRGHLGDATKEVIATDSASTYRGWYSDYASFVNSDTPFFKRGGHYGPGTSAGVFYFGRDRGYAISNFGGRPVAVHAS